MTLLKISAWLMLFFGGLWAGGILIFAVERTNLWRRMPIEQYSVDFRRSVFRADPMMPILSVVTAIASAAFAILRDGGVAGILAWTGVGLVLLVIIASITIAEPIMGSARNSLRRKSTEYCSMGTHPMTLLKISAWLILFFGGLWAGGILIFA